MSFKMDPKGYKVRELILTALFRPAATSVVKDDGIPLSWLESVTKLGGK